MLEHDILDFNVDLTKYSNKTLIIGNGFGLAFDAAFNKQHFSWNNLLEVCNIHKGSPLYNLLVSCNLDFELAYQKLNNTIDILKQYHEPNSRIYIYKQQIEILKNELVIAITNSHPDTFIEANPLESSKIENCRRFLRKFHKVYSLNYDLLIYWLRCYNQDYIRSDSFTTSNTHINPIFNS